MPSITVRRLSEEVHRALKAQAAAEGISAEEKARRVLADGVLGRDRKGLGTRMMDRVRELGLEGARVEFPRLPGGIEPLEFDRDGTRR